MMKEQLRPKAYEINFPSLFPHGVGKYPDPKHVVEKSLTLIEPDGSVIMLDRDTRKPFLSKLDHSVELSLLNTPKYFYQQKLVEATRVISDAVSDLRLMSELEKPDYDEIAGRFERLAKYLSSYNNQPRHFLFEATDLIQIYDEGKSMKVLNPYESSFSSPQSPSNKEHPFPSHALRSTSSEHHPGDQTFQQTEEETKEETESVMKKALDSIGLMSLQQLEFVSQFIHGLILVKKK